MITISMQKTLVRDIKILLFNNSRIIYIYSAAIMITGIVLIALTNMSIASGYYASFRNLELLAFGGLGFFHSKRIDKYELKNKVQGIDSKLIITIALSTVLTIVLLIIFLLLEPGEVYLAFACSSSFLLPTVIGRQWNEINTIAETRFEPWQIPETKTLRKASIAINSLRIHIKFAPDYFNPRNISFPVTQPARANLGNVFEQFTSNLNRYEKVIECYDENKKPYGWEFFVEKYKGTISRFLDPTISLNDNHVKSNMTIVAKRVKVN